MENVTVPDALDAWFARYERTASEDPDYTPIQLPVHPDPDQRGLIAVWHPLVHLGRIGRDLPAASYTVTSNSCQTVWFLDWPVMNTAETSKQWNTATQVADCLAYHLKGRVASGMDLINMLAFEDQLPASQPGYYLVAMREHLIANRLWTKVSTIPPGMQARGGSTRSAAQSEARRVWAAKGRAARSAQAAQKAAEVVEVAERGLELEEVAALLGLQPSSVQKTVSRARRSHLGISH